MRGYRTVSVGDLRGFSGVLQNSPQEGNSPEVDAPAARIPGESGWQPLLPPDPETRLPGAFFAEEIGWQRCYPVLNHADFRRGSPVLNHALICLDAEVESLQASIRPVGAPAAPAARGIRDRGQQESPQISSRLHTGSAGVPPASGEGQAADLSRRLGRPFVPWERRRPHSVDLDGPELRAVSFLHPWQ